MTSDCKSSPKSETMSICKWKKEGTKRRTTYQDIAGHTASKIRGIDIQRS